MTAVVSGPTIVYVLTQPPPPVGTGVAVIVGKSVVSGMVGSGKVSVGISVNVSVSAIEVKVDADAVAVREDVTACRLNTESLRVSVSVSVTISVSVSMNEVADSVISGNVAVMVSVGKSVGSGSE